MVKYPREDEDVLGQDEELEDAELDESDDKADEFNDGDLAEEETFFNCPYCYERISMLLDPTSGGGEYIEDCEVCCRPIQINFEVEDNKVSDVVAIRAQD